MPYLNSTLSVNFLAVNVKHFGLTAAEEAVITDALKRKWANGKDYQFNHTAEFPKF